MKGNAVPPYARDEILRRELFQRGFAEMRILRQKTVRAGMDVREVTAPATGNADFLGDLRHVVDQPDAPPAPAGFNRAH